MDWTIVWAGSFGVLGVIVGEGLGRRSEYNKWLREQRRVAYADVLAVAFEFSVAAVLKDAIKRAHDTAIAMMEAGELTIDDVSDDEIEGVVSKIFEETEANFGVGPDDSLLAAVARRGADVEAAVLLVAPVKVAQASRRLLDATRDITPPGDPFEVYTEWNSALVDFCKLARADLRIRGPVLGTFFKEPPPVNLRPKSP